MTASAIGLSWNTDGIRRVNAADCPAAEERLRRFAAALADDVRVSNSGGESNASR